MLTLKITCVCKRVTANFLNARYMYLHIEQDTIV